MNATTPNRTTLSPLDAIQRQISRAERDLIDQRTQIDDDEGMAVLFTGNHHDAFPRHLVVNNLLSPTEKTTWQVIRLSISDPNKPGATPRRNDVAAMVNCSPPTVTASKTMLRIRGWLTFCRSVRQGGRFVGDIFLLNDQPMSLQSTLEIDGSFVEFLESQLASKNQRLKTAAAETIKAVREMETGSQPTEVELMGTRIERAMSDNTHRSKIFAPVNAAFNDVNSAKLSEPSAFSDQSKNFATVELVKFDQNLFQRKNFAPVSKNFTPPEQEFFYSSGSSSFDNNNKYINTARVPVRGEQQKALISENDQAHDESLANHIEVKRRGRDGIGEDQERIWLQKYLPWLAYPAFDKYLTRLVAGKTNFLPVFWQKLKPLPNHSREDVALQILGHAAAWAHGWRDPIRDPVAYLHGLVERQKQGVLFLDDWALELKRCYGEKGTPYFTDSPEKMAWLRRMEEVSGGD